jgi:hypothetical protein
MDGPSGQGRAQVIRTYGLLWHADRVDWRCQNGSGALLGATSKSGAATHVQFRAQRGLYALYADNELVYVGQTGTEDYLLFKSLKGHRSDHLAQRWNRFSWFGTKWVTKQGELSNTDSVHPDVFASLNILEAIVIAVSEPRFNLQRGRWGQASQYFQYEP